MPFTSNKSNSGIFVTSTERKQDQLSGADSVIHNWNACVLLLVGLSITGFLAYSFKSIEESNAKARFASACKQMQLNIEARLHAHEQVLKGGAALFDASESVSRRKWHDYTSRINWDNHLKGIQGFGFAVLIPPAQLSAHVAQIRREGLPDYNVWPDGPRDIYTSIIYLEPFEGRNLRALGYDMWSEPVRRVAMEKARDENRATLTGKVTLVQEAEQAVQAGILMYVPVYRNGMPVDTVEQRRAALSGWVYSPFRMNDLMQGINDIPNQDAIRMKIFDGPSAAPSALLYDSAEGSLSYFDILPSDTLIWYAHLGGREWTLQFTPTAKYLNIDYGKARLVAVCGSIISLLLFFLIRSYQHTRRDALAIAEKLTAELRQSEARYHILVEQSSDAVFLCDLETLALEEVNLHFCQMLGYTYQQSRQLLLTDIVSTPKPEIYFNFQRLVDGGYSGLKEQVFRTIDGSLLDVEVSQSAVQVGPKKKIITTVRDISPRKRAEAERAQMERQLRQSQKMEALGQLTGGIAHDFNNILAAMLGYSNLAQTRYATDKDSKLAHYLEEITKAGERARDLVTCMLTYSRSQTNEVAAALDPVPLVKEVIKMLSTTIPSGIKLQAQIDDDIPAISMNPTELHQIVMNLVINARDAMVEHGCLDLRLSGLVEAAELCVFCKRVKNNALCQGDISGEYVSLSVTDTGCGISQENIKSIFDPFFTTKGVGKGSGLGLSVIYGIVRRSDGCIVVDSHPGNGSTFQVLLPAASNVAVDLPTDTASLPAISGGNGARILVVDDEPALVHYLADLLEGQNYAVDIYTDSVEALNYFRDNPQGIDAVITDQTMPNKSGIEIAGDMLALRPDLPVFLCSGYSDSIDENTQLLGIRRFFNKPVSATELLIALNEEITHPLR